MIVVDHPQTYSAKYGPSAHLISTIPGEEGTKELIEAAMRLGLRREWIQKRGTPHEHFDVFKGALKRAQQDPDIKQIDFRELREILQAKRAHALLPRL